MGCQTLSDARMFAAYEFLRLPNFGLGTLRELQKAFDAAYGRQKHGHLTPGTN